jgi:hypothetical protein
LHAALFANEEAACSEYFALSPSTSSGTDNSASFFSKYICAISVKKKAKAKAKAKYWIACFVFAQIIFAD